MTKILLHTCCAPCANECVRALRSEGCETTAFWFNPNIHPLYEYNSRRDALKTYSAAVGLPVIYEDTYGLRAFINAVHPDYDARCGYCYRTRLYETARRAAEDGYGAFTTSLLISPYQDHEQIRKTAEEAAAHHGIAFLYRDFRPLFREGQRRAREMNLYMQKYCGCVFSEEARYAKEPQQQGQA